MKYSTVLLVIFGLSAVVFAEESLYEILGVGRSASPKEIKAAYKALAKEWHPDKNQNPGANERFMKINEAYETLSDKEKRAEYDNFGTTSAQADGGRRGGHNPFGGFDDSPFGHFFRQDGGFGGFNFRFNGGRQESSVAKYRISLQNYKDTILPGSDTKPYLIYAYADFCYQCLQIENMWDKIVQDMNTIGMGIGSVHASRDRGLASKLRVSDVPGIIGVVGGQTRFFSGRFSVQDLRDFVRSMMPADTVAMVTDRNYRDFLAGWQDNRVRMLFFASKPLPTLRYVLPAYANRHRVAAGYVNLAHINSEDLRSEFNVPKGMESVLIFNEYSDRPVAQFSMNSLSLSSLNEAIESNRYLVLPRLSNQAMFNTLCPLHTSVRRKKLCVLLLANSKPELQPFMSSFRDFAKDRVSDRLKFAYIYEDLQGEFVSKLTKGQGVLNTTLNTLKVAVVWRSQQRQVQYDWLPDGWAVDEPDAELSRQRLTLLIEDSLRSRDVLPYSMEMMADLIDENRGHLVYRIVQRLGRWLEMGWEMLLSMDEMTLITFGTTLAFIVVIALMMRMMVTGDEERYNHRAQRTPRQDQYQPTRRVETPVVQVSTLCGDTFRSVVLDTPPGVRTIVLLVHEESRHKLLQDFANIVQPYARSDAFRFAYLQLEEYLPWYKSVLEATLDHSRSLDNINIANCIGTVLALNGRRKYLSVYHAVAESASHRRNRRRHRRRANNQVGDFLGLNDSDSDWETDEEGQGEGREGERLLDSMLLAGLQTWMDRLCEGSLRRLRVDEWPEMG